MTEMILCRSGCQYFGNIFVAKGEVVACLLKFVNFCARHPREKPKGLRAVTKEIDHVLLTRSFFGDGIVPRLLRRVSRAKPTSAPLRF